MPPKSKAPAEEGPRRSTRARTKRPAASDAEDHGTPAKLPKAAASKPRKTDINVHQPTVPPKGRKAKAAVTHDNDPHEDTKSTKAPKHIASGKQQAAHSTPEAPTQSKQKQPEPLAQAGNASAAAPPKLGAPAAASKSGQASASDSNQASAADPACPKAHSTKVAGDADVMLNQTNIGANNNKFYRMQLLQEGGSDYWLWTRWGRVGDKGQTQLQGPFDADAGLKEFKKKFRYAYFAPNLPLQASCLFIVLPLCC